MGEEEGKGFSFVLPPLLHPSALSSWRFGLAVPGRSPKPGLSWAQSLVLSWAQSWS